MPIAPAELDGIPTNERNLQSPDVGGDGRRLQDPLSGDLMDAGGAGAVLPVISVREHAFMPVGPGDVDLSVVDAADLRRGRVHPRPRVIIPRRSCRKQPATFACTPVPRRAPGTPPPGGAPRPRP